MKKIEELIQDYNKYTESFNGCNFQYNDMTDFAMWLDLRNYHLNGVSPCKTVEKLITVDTLSITKFLSVFNTILSKAPIKFNAINLIETLRDKGFLIADMPTLLNEALENVNEIIERRSI